LFAGRQFLRFWSLDPCLAICIGRVVVQGWDLSLRRKLEKLLNIPTSLIRTYSFLGYMELLGSQTIELVNALGRTFAIGHFLGDVSWDGRSHFMRYAPRLR